MKKIDWDFAVVVALLGPIILAAWTGAIFLTVMVAIMLWGLL